MAMGVEKQLKKWSKGQDLNIDPLEWQFAKAAVQNRISERRKKFFKRKIKFPFKLSRQELKNLYPKSTDKFDHSFIVVADPENKDGFKIAAMARGKSYTTDLGSITEGVLGIGGFGVVKIVQWEDGTQDALKIEAVGNKETEFEVMRKIGIFKATFSRMREKSTRWIDNKEIKDKEYILQTLQTGDSMKDYLTSIDLSKLTPQEKYNTAIEAAKAIQALHDRNVLHCDIKPANFMIDVQGGMTVVKPVDFGLSKILKFGNKKFQADIGKGTKGYASPEVANDASYSKSSDVYALGVMFKDDLKLAEEGSPLRDLVERMTDKWRPQMRPTMSEVVAALINPENYKAYENLYKDLGKYHDQKILKKQTFTLFSNFRMKDDTQLKLVADLNEILRLHRLSEKTDEDAIDEILALLKENQKHHSETTLALASSFNLKTIQNLPEKLKKGVLKKLDIGETDDLLKDGSYSNRKTLAKILSEYNPKALTEPPGTPKAEPT